MKYLPPNRRGTRLGAALALTAAASLAFAACGGGDTGPGSEQSPAEGGEEIAVTLITKTATNPFFISMQKGAEEAGKANNVSITTAAGKEDGDEATQIQAIEAARHGRHVGEVRRVLVEAVSERDPARVTGRTEHGLAASFEGEVALVGNLVDVRIEGASAYGLAGVLA